MLPTIVEGRSRHDDRPGLWQTSSLLALTAAFSSFIRGRLGDTALSWMTHLDPKIASTLWSSDPLNLVFTLVSNLILVITPKAFCFSLILKFFKVIPHQNYHRLDKIWNVLTCSNPLEFAILFHVSRQLLGFKILSGTRVQPNETT